ncbi:MAG TPA: hypothetical protein VMU03_04055, partial [Gammaproteobacteria bacterium]|nr:hypothetical protein [Gammaproteobacteria bacterium]
VRVVHALQTCQCPETDYVRVHTCAAPDDDTVTLATIERVVEKVNSDPEDVKPLIKRVKTLIMRLPMTVAEALDLATSYAERKKIPVVYADHG